MLTNWYEIKVVSVDGNAGIVDLQAAWRIRSFCLQICCTKSVAFVPVLFFALLCSKVLPLRFRCASFGPFLSINFQAKGPLPASCLGARFENAAGAISITTDDTCSLTSKLGAQSYSICYSYGSYDLLISIDMY